MNPSFLAVPALALTIGLGSVSTAEAHALPGMDPERRAAIEATFDSGDYQAFLGLTTDAPFAGKLTEDKFNVLVEARKLREAGNVEGAHDLLKEHDMHRPMRVLRRHRLKNRLQEFREHRAERLAPPTDQTLDQ